MTQRVAEIGRDDYPILLTEIADPPRRLFIGGKGIGNAPCIAVVGTRRASRYGLGVARRIASDLAGAGVVVISGMAKGIDSAAHRAALDASGRTVAVLGCGIDVCYPSSNRALYQDIREQGTFISEYPSGTRPRKHHFPARNRIIAGMSLGVVMIEGKTDGGAMITARLAMEAGREVFAVPGPVTSTQSGGPHSLIKDGATLVRSAGDVLEAIGWGQTVQEQLFGDGDMSADERRVLDSVEGTPLLLEAIARSSSMPCSSAASVLARLELRGLVVRHPGGRFSLL